MDCRIRNSKLSIFSGPLSGSGRRTAKKEKKAAVYSFITPIFLILPIIQTYAKIGTMDIRDLFRKNIRDLAPYSTARDEYEGDIGIYLDANENPYDNDYNRYPDPHQRLLKNQIAEIKSVPVENIFIGNGSDEPIDLAYRIFCEPGKDNAVSIAPSYGMYEVAAQTNDVEFRKVRLDENFGLDAASLLSHTDERTKLIFLCSPNNPSGNLLDECEVRKILENFPGIVVVDEAYIDFADSPGFLPELGKHPRLVVLQTLSKAWGMAGLRLGLAFAHREIVRAMSQVKYPYNINGFTQRIVGERLKEADAVREQIAEIRKQRERLTRDLPGFGRIKKVFPSDANFILVRVEDPRGLYGLLIERGVIVRDRSRIPGCEGCLRVTVGTPAENDRLLEILTELDAKQKQR